MEQRPNTLMARLDALEAAHGGAIAQSYIASGNPDDAPHELTFSEFVGEVRRRSNALTALGVGPSDVIGFAAPLSETSYPTMVAAMVTATYAPVNYFLEPAGAYPHRQSERRHCVPDPPALRRRTGSGRQAQAGACGASARAVNELRQRPRDRRGGGLGGDGRGSVVLQLEGVDPRAHRKADGRSTAHRRHHWASETGPAYRGDVRRHDRRVRRRRRYRAGRVAHCRPSAVSHQRRASSGACTAIQCHARSDSFVARLPRSKGHSKLLALRASLRDQHRRGRADRAGGRECY